MAFWEQAGPENGGQVEAMDRYLKAMEEFRRHAQKRLDHLGPDDIRGYQVALLEEKRSFRHLR